MHHFLMFNMHVSMFQLETDLLTFQTISRCMECRRGLAMRILSVCSSVCRTRTLCTDKTEEKSLQIFITYERTFNLVYGEEKWLVWATPFT